MTDAEGDVGEQSVPYRTPEAFRRALKERIAKAARSDSLYTSEIRRQFAYSRFLYRVFASADSGWVLKGATGLLARIPSRARHSLDIDLMRRDDMSEAIKLLQTLGHQHADTDFFTFDVQPERQPALDAPNAALSATAYLGERQFESFKIDLVVESNMTAEPEYVSPMNPVEIAGLRSVPYLVYPLVDHIADKHAAMLDDYRGRPSTRYRDLVDLAIIAGTESVNAAALSTALHSEYAHRRIQTPTVVTLPSNTWIPGYAQAAKDVANLPQRTADEALELVGKLLNPILAGRKTGTWNPDGAGWED
ncbi:nucleotidyl transferase AbiEii/AbiGii toxin family protein [Candidatus Poriferisodalis sp.]|uniref:nucleotidyl transferase AbiEii/AbiGii toxin family protein n=1 Tax=Candidatus Poriferisodalis sp. TaxID=3101277 RepID=UPI003AF70D4F